MTPKPKEYGTNAPYENNNNDDDDYDNGNDNEANSCFSIINGNDKQEEQEQVLSDHDDTPQDTNGIIFVSTTTLALCWCTLTHSWLLISVFPYSGFMAVDLIDGLTEETAGSYAGWIASAFMLGRAFSSYGWGKAADRYGRKFVLIASLTLSMMFSILFGLSTSFRMALLWRFLLGMSNGMIGTVKTIVSETAGGDESVETKSMGLVMGMWGWGFLFSPALSGVLAEPLRQYPDAAVNLPDVLYGMLSKFPFILPNLLSAVFCCIAVLGVQYSVRETLSTKPLRHPVHIPLDILTWVITSSNKLVGAVRQFVLARETRNSKQQESQENDEMKQEQYHHAVPTTVTTAADLENSNNNNNNNNEFENDNDTIRQSRMFHTESCSLLSTASPDKSIARRKVVKQEEGAEATVLSLWSQRTTRNHLIVNWVYSFAAIALEEAFPLYCISKGSGLGLSEVTIGKLLSASGLLFAISQYFVYSYVVDTVGLKRSIQLGAILSGPILVLLPISRSLNHNTGVVLDQQDGLLTWTAFLFLSILLACYRVFSMCFFSSISIASNRTVLDSHRGTMNGLNMLGGSISKGLAPIFAGALVSFSTSSGVVAPPEFGGVVIFSMFGVLGAINVAMTVFLL